MMGLDSIGAALIFLALSLMTVDPMHCTIARTKSKAAWFAGRADGDHGDTSPAAGSDGIVAEVDTELADDPLIHATGELADIFNHI